jgi:hypothetical protein
MSHLQILYHSFPIPFHRVPLTFFSLTPFPSHLIFILVFTSLLVGSEILTTVTQKIFCSILAVKTTIKKI